MVKESLQIRVAEQILDGAIMNKKPYYLIKWKDLPHQNDTWEPIQNLGHIVQMLREFIMINREQRKQKGNLSSQIESLCQSVNSKSAKKRKMIRKAKLNRYRKIQKPEIVNIIDEESESSLDKEQQQSIQNQQKLQAVSQIQQNLKHESIEDKISEQAQISQKNEIIPEKQASNNNNKGMKVVGTVTPQQIIKIIENFEWKGVKCFKILLDNEKITNMREDDLKLLCPQILAQYYEYKGIDF